MNAVNLIPRERRDRRFAVSMSPPTIALLAGLGAALVAIVLYVSAANGVTSRQNELARLTASTAQAQALSNSLTGNVTAVQQLSSQVATVRQLAGGRYPWPRMLDQIGRLMPAGTALISLQSGGAPGTPGTASTAAGSAASGTGGSAPTSLQLAGCAASQSTVALTMERLRGVTGVSAVQLASSTDLAGGSSSGTSTAGTGSATCAYPVQFQMSLTFGSPSGAGVTGTSTTGATP
jgi:Tfp pilus assembly protein PilN